MKKTRSLDRDGLDGILPPTDKAQAKADNSQAQSDKAQAKPLRGKVIWLFGGAVSLLVGVVLLQMPRQNPPSATLSAAAEQSTAPRSSGDQASSGTVSQRMEPTGDAVQVAAESMPIPVASTKQDYLPSSQSAAGETYPADQPVSDAEVLAQLPTEPTAAGVKKSPDTVAEPTPAKALFTVHFKFDSSKLTPLAPDESANLLSAAKACPGRLSLIGHTCNLGPDASNLQLGLARANALKKWLIGNGIAAERIAAASDGMSKPVAANDTKAGQALNRRAELYCLDP